MREVEERSAGATAGTTAVINRDVEPGLGWWELSNSIFGFGFPIRLRMVESEERSGRAT